jgi:hypothetical protein
MSDLSQRFPKLYGVWTPKIGWLRGDENRAYATPYWWVAFQVARRVGRGSRVYFIDDALAGGTLEKRLLDLGG